MKRGEVWNFSCIAKTRKSGYRRQHRSMLPSVKRRSVSVRGMKCTSYCTALRQTCRLSRLSVGRCLVGVKYTLSLLALTVSDVCLKLGTHSALDYRILFTTYLLINIHSRR